MIQVRGMGGEQHGHVRDAIGRGRTDEERSVRTATVRAVNRPTAAAPVGTPLPVAPLMVRGNGITCRVQPWSFQPYTAQLVMYQQVRLPSLQDLQRWAEELCAAGFTRMRTTALATTAALRAESAGFHMIQDLVLLEHREPREAAAPTLRTRRLLVAQHGSASEVDRAAFTDDWALETRAVAEVCGATPRHRARAAGSPLTGYAISGRDGKQGFLQRLAVTPAAQGNGIGRALVLDSLQWLARWRVQQVLVNTPVDNERALHLYESLGFRRMSERLRVFERALT
jgi:ribosomal-protein-alanine N-acetyltransferase